MCPGWYIWEAEGLVKKKVKVKVGWKKEWEFNDDENTNDTLH